VDAVFKRSELTNLNKILKEIKSFAGVMEVGLFLNLASKVYFASADGIVYEKTRTVTTLTQKSTLDLIFEQARKNKAAGIKSVVELDLDVTALLPYERTILGLRAAGAHYNINEFSNPLDHFGILPGYTEPAFEEFLKVSRLTEKYTHIQYRSPSEADTNAWFGERNFVPIGKPGSSVYSVFHRNFWGAAEGLEGSDYLVTDAINHGLVAFEQKLSELDCSLVFISGRFMDVQRTPSYLSLLKSGIPKERIHVYVAGNERGQKSDSYVKLQWQDEIIQKYGIPIAVIDDRKESREDVVNQLSAKLGQPVLSVGIAVPGFTSDPTTNNEPLRISTFESD